MRKTSTIIMILVFVLGIAGSAFAANPFSDVPANHWAYASISKLAEAGVIEGYGSGRFVGSSNITRYEVAQIVAKALARSDRADAAQKAQIERLAAEFAKELESLGVRVGKLEKKLDNVTITGTIRFANYGFDDNTKKPATSTGTLGSATNKSTLRSDITLRGQVNDRWNYYGMFRRDVTLRENANSVTGNTSLKRAWVDGKVGDVRIRAGRFGYFPVYGEVIKDDSSALVVGYAANNWSVEAFALRPEWLPNANYGSGYNLNGTDGRINVYGGVVGYDFNKSLKAQLAYYDADGKGAASEFDGSLLEIALGYKFNKELSLRAEYLRNDEDWNDEVGKDGWIVGLNYSTLSRSKPGTFAVRATYYDVAGGNVVNASPELDPAGSVASGGSHYVLESGNYYNSYDGFKGYQLGASYVLGKNIVLAVDWWDLEGQKNAYDQSLLWTQLYFYF
jgi:hypothetical protein